MKIAICVPIECGDCGHVGEIEALALYRRGGTTLRCTNCGATPQFLARHSGGQSLTATTATAGAAGVVATASSVIETWN